MAFLYHRQLSILPPEKITTGVTIVGTGSVGSFVALSLVKMGVKELELWDSDKVELHNIANQYFRLEDLNKYKVEACRDLIMEQSCLLYTSPSPRDRG